MKYLIIIILGITLTSCSKGHTTEETKTISFSLQKSPLDGGTFALTPSAQSALYWGQTTPSTISGFNCFFLLVGYPENEPDLGCQDDSNLVNNEDTVNNILTNDIIGLFGKSGSTATTTATVTTGSGRVIKVAGTYYSDADTLGCNNLLNNMISLRANLSPIFILGSTTETIDDQTNSVTLNASFDTSSTEITNCGNGDTGLNYFNSIEFTQDIETASISVDGSFSDWSNITAVLADTTNDSTLTNVTDIDKAYIVKDGTDLAIRLDLVGNFTFPHTSGETTSHYEVAIRYFTDATCENESSRFAILSNFSDSVPNITNEVTNYDGSTAVSNNSYSYNTSTTMYESKFALSEIPTDITHISLSPQIQSFPSNACVGSVCIDYAKSFTCIALNR